MCSTFRRGATQSAPVSVGMSSVGGGIGVWASAKCRLPTPACVIVNPAPSMRNVDVPRSTRVPSP